MADAVRTWSGAVSSSGPGEGIGMLTAGAQTKKILVVDDESAILQTLRFNLERNG